MLYLGIFIFGLATFPIFSLSAAHANDFSSSEEMAELNTAIIFTFAIGAIVSPLFSGGLIYIFGPTSVFLLIGLSHAVLIFYGLYRMGIRSTIAERTPYIYLPRTSAVISWFLTNKDEKK
jgi:MFS family permease